MCRFVLYLGKPIHLSSLITEPENSLIHQSFDSREREEPLNGDGFGVAWYPPDGHRNAALFRSITPAWSNQNLRHLAQAVRSSCVLAHVRAASSGIAVSEANTHPFVAGPYSFVHNGEVAEFRRHRRALLGLLDDERYRSIEGTTDSECLFSHALQHLASRNSGGAETLADALERAIAAVMAQLDAAGVQSPTLINAVLSNGREAAACRYSSVAAVPPASLHLHTGRLYSLQSGRPRLIEADEDEHAVILASEPLTQDSSWRVVPAGSMVLIDARRTAAIRPMALGRAD